MTGRKGLHRLFPRPPGAPSGATVITSVVVGAWALTYVVGIFSPSFEPPASLDPLMLLIAGAYFTNRAVSSQKNDSEKDDSDE